MLADVQNALNPIIESLGHTTVWPNRYFDPNNLDGVSQEIDTYLRVTYLWSRAENQTLKCGRQPGILQLDVFVLDDVGEIKALTIVDQIKTAFQRGSTFTYSGTDVFIDSIPYPAPGLNDDNGWYFIPVNVPFEVAV